MKLELRGVSARHPAARPGAQAALRGVSLSVASGEQIAVIGPSGAGKTTLLHVLACALPPTQGEVVLDDAVPWSLQRMQLRALRGRLFLAPQTPPLPPRQRVVTAVLAGRLPTMGLLASLRSLFYPADIPAAYMALDRFDLANKLFDRVDRLSGGERQRVGLARAIVAMGPTPNDSSAAASAGATLLLIDEPLSALDPTRAAQAMATLVDESRARGVTLVATLHQVDMALAHFPRIVGLRDGVVAFDLPTAQVTRERLATLYAQREDELHADDRTHVVDEPAPAAPAPVVMHCR